MKFKLSIIMVSLSISIVVFILLCINSKTDKIISDTDEYIKEHSKDYSKYERIIDEINSGDLVGNNYYTWEKCTEKAFEIGMSEYDLRLMAGWIVNERYVYCDEELALLSAYVPLYYWSNGINIADGVAGDDDSGMYSEESLLHQCENISQQELGILYESLNNPRYDIFGCDGVSWYDGCTIIYEAEINGCTIRIWAM